MHYTFDSLDWLELGGTGWRRACATLEEGDSAWHPGSTKHQIYGPALVTYEQAPDGGVSAMVEEG